MREYKTLAHNRTHRSSASCPPVTLSLHLNYLTVYSIWPCSSWTRWKQRNSMLWGEKEKGGI